MATNEELINEIIEKKKLENRSPEYINLLKTTLEKLDSNLNKPFKKANEKDIIKHLNQYSTTTRRSRLPMIKMFYRHIFRLDKTETPECLKRIDLPKIKHNDVVYRERIITPEEYDLIISSAGQAKHKAMIETFYEFGIRRSELLSMNIKDVKYENGKTRITVRESKTKTRDIIVKGRCQHLLLWIENLHPEKSKPNCPLFYSTEKNRKKRYSKNSINALIKRIGEKAEINKTITPHDFRHTFITRKLQETKPTNVMTLAGLSKNTKVLATYDHNNIEDYEKELDKEINNPKPTYKTLERQKKENEVKQNEIEKLKIEIEEMKKTFKPLLDIGLDKFVEHEMKNLEK